METFNKFDNGLEPTSELQQLYTSNWQNLMAIVNYEDEISMFKDMLKTKFTDKFEDENMNEVQMLDLKLNQVKYIKNNTKQDILLHKENLEAKTIVNTPVKSEFFLRLEHEKVAGELFELTKRFNSLKEELYKLNNTPANAAALVN